MDADSGRSGLVFWTMVKALRPFVIGLLRAGAIGTSIAMSAGVLLWVCARALGVSYQVDNRAPITLTQVAINLAVVGLSATALAVALAQRDRGVLIFGVLCVAAFLVSIISPITLAADFETACTLVAHHALGGLLVSVPLLRQLAVERTQYR